MAQSPFHACAMPAVLKRVLQEHGSSIFLKYVRTKRLFAFRAGRGGRLRPDLAHRLYDV
jgi:hypothetical protein